MSSSLYPLRMKYLSHAVFCVYPYCLARPVRRLSATGQETTAWFDLYSFDLLLDTSTPGQEDEDGIRRSIASLDVLLSEVVGSGVDPSRVVLGGFSQGAAMTLLTGLTTPTKLAGLFALSGRLPLRNHIKSVCICDLLIINRAK